MPMNDAYLNAIADSGKALITHIGLVDNLGNELSGGAYARKPVTWTAALNGDVKPSADLVFDVAAGAVVAGWRGYSALTAGTDYGGAALTQVTFNNAGTYTLQAAATAINHDAA